METFANRLARIIKESGVSDAAVADALGLSEAQAKRVKDGTTKSLKLEPALRLCRKLGVSPWDLAGVPPLSTLPKSEASADDLSQTGSRLPEGPVADALAALREQVHQIRQVAERAQSLAEAAEKASKRRGRKSA